MKKKIQLDDNNLLSISIDRGFTETTMITRYFRFGNLIKNLSFSIWDDIAFRGYSSEQTDSLEFIISINDPLYFCFNRLLDSDLELFIDDDDTSFDRKKYILIKKEGYCIKVIFYNLLFEKDYYPEEKFRVFIKNIGPDPRSKIDDYDFKCRIIRFFRDCKETLLEEYHQITMDEYLEILNYSQDQCRNKVKKL